MDQSINVIIMGAAGRDFHNFNIYYRDNPRYRVTAFTATQIPNIDGRVYPPELAGALYPSGIPIYPESELVSLIKKNNVKEVVFSYSDVTHNYVMSKASEVLAAGADFRLLGPASTMLKSSKPVIAVTAVRTGVGKSQTTRRVCDILREGAKWSWCAIPCPTETWRHRPASATAATRTWSATSAPLKSAKTNPISTAAWWYTPAWTTAKSWLKRRRKLM